MHYYNLHTSIKISVGLFKKVKWRGMFWDYYLKKREKILRAKVRTIRIIIMLIIGK